MIYSEDEDGFDDHVDGFDNRNIVHGRNGVIFAVDCCKEMFAALDSAKDTAFSRVIMAVHDMLLNKIISNDKDMHAVVFFETSKANNAGDLNHIYVWQDFDVPSVQTIVQLRDMLAIDVVDFQAKYGLNQDCQISDLLWTCLNLFSASRYKLATKTLILFPWRDDPHFGDVNSCVRTKTKASDLHDFDVDVQVASFNEKFEMDKFYKDILSDPDGIKNSDPLHCITNLYHFLLRKCYKQRPISRVPMRFGADLEIFVSTHTVARRATKASGALLDSASNLEIKQKTNYVDANTGEILMPSDLKLKQTWGGMDIIFEKEDVESTRKLKPVGFTLLGFKPTASVKAQHHVRTAQFIYPDEESIEGSTSLFNALLQKCFDKKLVAICWYAARGNSAPKLVALMPQVCEADDETQEIVKSPGFYVVFLPFADDLRHVSIDKSRPRATQEQVHAAEAVIKRLRFGFDPENFDNPALQLHYKNLEAMALQKGAPDPIEDYTIPDTKTINRKAEKEIRDLKDLLFPPGYEASSNSVKRKAAAPKTTAKKSKDAINVEKCVADDSLGRYTVADLKGTCKSLGISSVGKKADLIAAITRHVNGD